MWVLPPVYQKWTGIQSQTWWTTSHCCHGSMIYQQHWYLVINFDCTTLIRSILASLTHCDDHLLTCFWQKNRGHSVQTGCTAKGNATLAPHRHVNATLSAQPSPGCYWCQQHDRIEMTSCENGGETLIMCQHTKQDMSQIILKLNQIWIFLTFG